MDNLGAGCGALVDAFIRPLNSLGAFDGIFHLLALLSLRKSGNSKLISVPRWSSSRNRWARFKSSKRSKRNWVSSTIYRLGFSYDELPLLSGDGDDVFCNRTPVLHFAMSGFLAASSVEIPLKGNDMHPSVTVFDKTLLSLELVVVNIDTLDNDGEKFLCLPIDAKVRPYCLNLPKFPELLSEHQSSERPLISPCWLDTSCGWFVCNNDDWLTSRCFDWKSVFFCINSLNTLLVISLSVVSCARAASGKRV